MHIPVECLSISSMASVVVLCRGTKKVKETISITRVSERTVFQWIERFKDGGKTSNTEQSEALTRKIGCSVNLEHKEKRKCSSCLTAKEWKEKKNLYSW